MQFSLDSHKLHYHPDRVAEFLKKGDCYPLYVEISPVGSCNHRCIFCAYDYIGYPNRKLKKERLLEFLEEVKEAGVKSMLYAGEGEPLMHPDIDDFVVRTKELGIDVGMFTNGELLKDRLSDKAIGSLTFLRFSVNGGDRKTYSEIHQRDRFDKVIENIEYVKKLKEDKKLETTLGVQFVLLPENIDSLENLIFILRDIGVDYLSIKPFVLQNENQFYRNRGFDIDIYAYFKKIEAYSNENFKVVARLNAFKKYGKRTYKHCYGCNFITILDSGGNLISCLPYLGKEEFMYGNIYENSFKEIWHSEKRKQVKELLEKQLDVQKVCPPNCRPNAINEYLYELKHPSVAHVNFI
ncbi:radical SAM protein [Hippea jasoniae]|uniref:radical SAM protein n=1 Tax=Hippea jasoniae TaxID=944479 RepID=UPI00054CF15C|nr:radical SAM protein [Hippea jasoniae]